MNKPPKFLMCFVSMAIVLLSQHSTAMHMEYPSVLGFQDSLNITLIDYTVHKVKKEKPYVVMDDQWKKQVFETAYLVQFEMKNLPSFRAQMVDFWIGEYKIPEYGGTQNGIYFRIYDQKKLMSLQGKPIYYKFGDEMIRTEKVFNVEDISTLEVLLESQILK